MWSACTLFNKTRNLNVIRSSEKLFGEETASWHRDLISSRIKRTTVGQKEKHMQTWRAEPNDGGGGAAGGVHSWRLGVSVKVRSIYAAKFFKASAESWRGLGGVLVYRWWEIISYSVQQESPDSPPYHRMKYWGQDRSGTLMTYQSAAVARLLVYLAAGWVNLDHVRSIN